MLHLETVEPSTLGLLKRIQSLPVLADTRLVGGTALALQLGHRVSVDLDVFGQWDLSQPLEDHLSQCGTLIREGGTGKILSFTLDGVKVDCVAYPYRWLEPAIVEDEIRLAGIADIAAMKLNAITNRGTRKDFVDLAVLLGSHPLGEMMDWFCAKYTGVNPALAWRSVTYFEDAETMPMPRMLVPLGWDDVKARILGAVRDHQRKRGLGRTTDNLTIRQ